MRKEGRTAARGGGAASGHIRGETANEGGREIGGERRAGSAEMIGIRQLTGAGPPEHVTLSMAQQESAQRMIAGKAPTSDKLPRARVGRKRATGLARQKEQRLGGHGG